MIRALPTIIDRFFPVFENEEILMEPLVEQKYELPVEPRHGHRLSVEMITDKVALNKLIDKLKCLDTTVNLKQDISDRLC